MSKTYNNPAVNSTQMLRIIYRLSAFDIGCAQYQSLSVHVQDLALRNSFKMNVDHDKVKCATAPLVG